MAKNYSVTFSILGNLDPSLLNALKSASDKIKSLGDLAKNISPKALSQARALQNARDVLKQVEAFNKLRGVMTTLRSAQAANLILASRARSQQAAETKRLGEMRAAYQKLNDQFKANRRSMDAAARSAWHDNLKAARAEIKAQARLVDDLGKQELQHSAQATKLRAQLATQQNKLNQLRATLPPGVNTSAEAQLRAQIEQTTNALNQEIAALERRNQLFNTFNQRGQELSNAWGNFQNSLSTAQTLTSPFTSAIDKAIQFEHTMSTLKSISQMDLIKAGDTAQVERNMARLTAQAKELGATTIYTAQQVGEAQVYIARTGWNTDAIIKSMPSILKLAAANRMDIEPTADIVTNIMTAFGHGVDQVEKDADVFAYTVTHSNQTLSQFGEAMKYAAPVAKLFGASIEEAAMMTKFMGDAGIQGSMAGTSMRQTMLRLTAPPKKASKAMDELGVSTSDATKSWNEAQEVAASYGVTLDSSLSAGRQFISIMEQIDRGFAGRSDREKLAAMSAITGINAVSGAANVFGAGAKQAKNFTELLEQCRGALEQTYATMTDDTFGAQKSFESAWEAVQLSMGGSLLGISRAGYEFAAPLLTSLSQFIDANPAIVQACAAIAAALATATVAVGAFSLAMAGIRFAQAGWATAGIVFSDLTTKILALRTALTGLSFASVGSTISAGLAAASTAVKNFGRAMLVAGRASLAFIATPIGAALTAIALAGLWAYQNWDKVGPVLSKIADTLGKVVSPAIDSVFNVFSTLGEALRPVSGILSTLANAVGGTLAGAFVGLLGTVASVVSGIIVLLAGLLKSVGTMGLAIAEAFEKIKSGDFSGAFDSLSKGASKAADDVAKAFDNAGKTIDAGLKATAQGLRELTFQMPSAEVVARHRVEFDETGAARSTPVDVSSVQPIDTSALQSSVDNAASSMEQVSTPASGAATAFLSALFPAQMLTAALSQAAPATQQLGYSSLTAAASANAMGSSALMSVGSIGAMSASADGSVGSINALGGSADGATGGVDALGSASGGASGNVLGLGDAAGSAIDALLGAASRAGDAISSAASSAWSSIKSFVGVGGFARGGLVEEPTFFAGEHGREMIIPLTEHHKRATNLWRAAGQMLGILPTTEGRKPDWSIKRVPRLPGGLKMPRINFPLSTPPTFPEPMREPLRLPELRTSRETSSGLPPLNVTINVTIHGQADESTVRRGIESAMPTLRRTFAEELGDYRREQLRRSFR